MGWKEWLLSGGIVIFFLGVPLLCLALPLVYGAYLFSGYTLVCLMLWFILGGDRATRPTEEEVE